MYGATAWKLGILWFDSTTNQAVCSIQNPDSLFIEKYIFYFLSSIREKIIKDSFWWAQPNISKGYLDTLDIPLPSPLIQQRIVSKLDESFANLNRQIDFLKGNISEIEELGKSALEKAFGEGEFEMKKLIEVCEFWPKKTEAKLLDESTMVSFVPMKYMNEKSMYFDVKESKMIKEIYSCYTYFRDNDVLLAKVTPCFENWKSWIAKNLINWIWFWSSEFSVFRTHDNVLPEWIYYLFSTDAFLKEWANNMSWAVWLKRVTKDFLENYKLPVPPLEKQKEIVAHLDQIFEKNKALKFKFESQIQSLEELKQSLLKDAFEGRLVHE